MKKLLVAIVLAATLLITAPTQANTPETADVTPHKLPSSMIDGIEVPYDVLEYAQMKYQGHAVTKVQKTYRGSEQVYRLRVDRDDIADDYESIILLYSLKWKLIGEEKMVAPPRPHFIPPNQEDDKKEAPEPKPRQEDDPEPTGGHGGDQSEEPEPEPEEPELPDDDFPEEEEDLIPPGRRRR